MRIKANNEKDAILTYLKVLYSFHKLTDKEMETFTEIILKYKGLQKKYDDEIANTLYLSRENRLDILSRLGMTGQTFRNYLSDFRKAGLITDKGVNPVFAPDFKEVTIEITILHD